MGERRKNNERLRKLLKKYYRRTEYIRNFLRDKRQKTAKRGKKRRKKRENYDKGRN